MPQSLPPRGIFIPTQIAYDPEIPAAALFVWIRLRGLAWENGETPGLTMDDIQKITGKGHSVIYGHMTLLRARGALRWRPIENGQLVVSFDNTEIYSENPEYHSGKPELNSGKSECAVNQSLNTSNPIDSGHTPEISNTQKELTSKVNVVGHSGKPESSPKNRNGRGDERSKTPAILCVKGITGKFPPKQLYDEMIELMGQSPDGKRLAECYREWLKRGYNPNSYTWALEWYKSGIPERNGSKSTPRNGGYNPDVFDQLRKERANGQ